MLKHAYVVRVMVTWIVAGIGSLLWAGCSMTPGRVETDFGTAYRLSKMNQVLNPQAEKNLEPVVGLDGEAAQKVLTKYRKEFEKSACQQQPVYTLGIMTGTGTGTGGGK